MQLNNAIKKLIVKKHKYERISKLAEQDVVGTQARKQFVQLRKWGLTIPVVKV